jgi:gamma-glutamyltranspeptidase/glutathione hydrolase
MSIARGALATSHPQAVEAGARVLEQGGNAVDAAVTAAAVLSVVEPMSVGLGGDLVAMVWQPGALVPTGVTSIGWSGSRATLEFVHSATGSRKMPTVGPLTVTVPGAVAGFHELLSRFGSWPVPRILEPAAFLARAGYLVPPSIARLWADGADRLSQEAAAIFLVDGEAPRAGDRMTNPPLANFLETLSERGLGWFYEESAASHLIAALGEEDGPLETRDVLEWPGPQVVTPLQGSFRGYDIFEMPPPTQGVSVLEALALYQSEPLPADEHALIECSKIALEDAGRYVCDPDLHEDASAKLLDPAFLKKRVRSISPHAARPTPVPGGSDTVFVAAIDREGRACSLIQSLYQSFGSGLLIPETGVLLHNRAECFRSDPARPNALEPRKRPYHTILPSMIGKRGNFVGSFGVVGGFMQPQGQVQLLHHLFEWNLPPESAVASPRWRILGGRRLGVEEGFDDAVIADLELKGHEIEPLPSSEAGGAQLLMVSDRGIDGASDPRGDGKVAIV